MTRATWSGAIAFGLVNIPVKLYPATQSKDIAFTSLHTPCDTPLKRPYFCPKCETQVMWKEIQKGYEYAKGKYVVLSEEELEMVPLETSKALNVVGFVDLEEIDPIYYESSYYLGPGEGSSKAFELLRQALALTGKVAIAQATMWKKEHVVAIRPNRTHLILSLLFHEDELKAPPDVPSKEPIVISDAEVELAKGLIGALAMSFDPSRFKDRYREALMKLIEAKIEGRIVKPPEERVEPTVDLMQALRASIEAVKKV